ncbi:MAG TPA: hypothetical protein VGF69_04040 [Thermoanaerobaculia bacterium]|jgi:hypothetical protein
MKRIAALLLILTAACGGETPQQTATTTATQPTTTQPAAPPPPTIAEAQTLLASAPEFGEYEFTNAAFSLPMTRAAMTPDARKAADALKKAGWLSFDSDGNVLLSDKARNDRRFVVRQNGFTDIVPLAKKELVAVESSGPDPEGARVTFTWKWIPNELGELVAKERFAQPQRATATLIPSGTGWAVLRIVNG